VTRVPSANRLAGLDHLRALAIILVFIYHSGFIGGRPDSLDGIGAFGWNGVDLFFVLSGYLIGGQLLARIARHQSISYGEFYLKRSMRILPAYLVVLTLYFLIPAFRERSELPPLWRFLTFTQNYGLDLVREGAFSHAWSLCIEEQFYLGLPLLILLITAIGPARQNSSARNDSTVFHDSTIPQTGPSHRSVWVLPVLFLLGFALRLYNWYHFLEPILRTPDHPGFATAYYKWIYYPAYTRLDGLLAGVSLAALYHFRPQTWQRITRHGNKLLLASLALIATAWWVAHDDYQYSFRGAIFGYPLISLAYGVLVLAALSPSCFLYRYPSRLTALIAALSYSIYLTHKQILHLSHKLLDRWFDPHGWPSYLIGIAICLLGGWLLRIAVEQPFLRVRDKWLRRSRPTPPPATIPGPPVVQAASEA
jgi:peptidoglycan/LPS O-acetylase OafA/YrhL